MASRAGGSAEVSKREAILSHNEISSHLAHEHNVLTETRSVEASAEVYGAIGKRSLIEKQKYMKIDVMYKA